MLRDYNKNRNKALDEETYSYVDSYVAIIDVLGFSKIVEKKSFTEVENIYRFAAVESGAAPSMLSNKDEGIDFKEIYDALNIICLSDSFIISLKSTFPRALECVVRACYYIQTTLIANNPHVLTRGGITKGDFFSKDEVTFGMGLVRAHELESSLAIYPRIILDDILNDEIENSNIDYLLVGEDGYRFLDYLKFLYERSDICIPQKNANIKKHMESLLKSQLKDREKAKINWFKEYHNNVIDKLGTENLMCID